jgi:hypothetical protein
VHDGRRAERLQLLLCPRKSTINAVTTNINPVRAAADDPRTT